jgi:hypothetical protein
VEAKESCAVPTNCREQLVSCRYQHCGSRKLKSCLRRIYLLRAQRIDRPK